MQAWWRLKIGFVNVKGASSNTLIMQKRSDLINKNEKIRAIVEEMNKERQYWYSRKEIVPPSCENFRVSPLQNCYRLSLK